MLNLFEKQDLQLALARLEKLKPSTQANWGKMNVAQMLAHVNVAYEMTYEDNHKKPNAFVKFILKLLVKNSVVGPKPYPKNGKTAPQFIITDERDFNKEKARLIDYLNKTQEIGSTKFNNRESHSFGPLSANEWNVMFSKHIDHHFTQFGV